MKVFGNSLFLLGCTQLAFGACAGVLPRAATPTAHAAPIVTPQPTQPGMVDNCNTFYYVRSGDTCNGIASAFHITVNNLVTWNTGAGKDCTTLWANTYACVGVSSD